MSYKPWIAATSGEDLEGEGRRAASRGEVSSELEVDVRIKRKEERLGRRVAVADELCDAPFVDAVFLGSE
jgi:hypothetical protein